MSMLKGASIFIAACIALASASDAFELTKEPPTKDDIVCKLNPKCKPRLTRSLKRGLTVQGAEEDTQPLSVNLYVNFAYNSDELSSDTLITLNNLGAALRDPRLASFTFMIAGHTDAKGSVEFNQLLSQRRAEAVKRYLVSQFSMSPERLSAVGYGKTQLLDPADPESGVNRRVQVINTTGSAARN